MDREKASGTTSRIGAINGLRGCAILMVVLHHLFIPYTRENDLHAGEIDTGSLFAGFINNAWLGVHIFFVLSGFVLYLPYCLKKRAIDGAADFRSFYLHRARRLLPLYFIVVLVTMALHSKAPAGAQNWYLELGALLSTLFTFSPHGFMPPSNVVLWSVSVEIWFSLLFPVLVLLVKRFSIEKVVVASLIICWGFGFAGSSIAVERTGHFLPFTNGLLGLCYEFVLGMYVCHLFVRGAERPQLARRHGHLLIPGALLMALAYSVLVGALPLPGFPTVMIFTIGFSCLLLGLISRANPLAWVLELWPLQLLGCMCYSIYAWHGVIMNEMIPPEPSHLVDTFRLLAPYLFVMLALSALSYRYIEFGRERNARALFLLPALAASRAAPTVPADGA